MLRTKELQLKLIYFNVFLFCAENKARSALKKGNCNKMKKTSSNMILSDLCVVQGWQNVLYLLNAHAQEAA